MLPLHRRRTQAKPPEILRGILLRPPIRASIVEPRRSGQAGRTQRRRDVGWGPYGLGSWRKGRDLNPRYGCPYA